MSESNGLLMTYIYSPKTEKWHKTIIRYVFLKEKRNWFRCEKIRKTAPIVNSKHKIQSSHIYLKVYLKIKKEKKLSLPTLCHSHVCFVCKFNFRSSSLLDGVCCRRAHCEFLFIFFNVFSFENILHWSAVCTNILLLTACANNLTITEEEEDDKKMKRRKVAHCMPCAVYWWTAMT